MAASDCASILKRGYLIEKKGGFMDNKKRWFVLRQDGNHSYCVLENYRDERSAIKGESPKTFINIFDVVDVVRVTDKKQSFQLLCPGLAYRFMANSESEADEWASCIRRLILYKREDAMNIYRILSQSAIPMSTSPPNFVPTTQSLTTLPQSTHSFVPPPLHTSNLTSFPSETQITDTYPTPPESVVTVPAVTFVKQNSLEGMHPYPSPPSSDNSSNFGGSNTSFDNNNQSFDDQDFYTKTKFRVHVKESERLPVSGPCDLLICEDCIGLYLIQTGQLVGTWPIHSIKRYGVNNVCFTFESGRNCFTGESKFFFYSPQSRIIHNLVHKMAQSKSSALFRSFRRTSAPESLIHRTNVLQTIPSTTDVSQTLPPNFVSSRPPYNHKQQQQGMKNSNMSLASYNHIEHVLRPAVSSDPYGKINRSGTPSQPPDYERLNHNYGSTSSPALIRHASTPPITSRNHSTVCNYVTIQHEEDVPIYSNVTFTQDDDDIPPPLPPRLSKSNSS